jgi:hypothetical protein
MIAIILAFLFMGFGLYVLNTVPMSFRDVYVSEETDDSDKQREDDKKKSRISVLLSNIKIFFKRLFGTKVN